MVFFNNRLSFFNINEISDRNLMLNILSNQKIVFPLSRRHCAAALHIFLKPLISSSLNEIPKRERGAKIEYVAKYYYTVKITEPHGTCMFQPLDTFHKPHVSEQTLSYSRRSEAEIKSWAEAILKITSNA